MKSSQNKRTAKMKHKFAEELDCVQIKIWVPKHSANSFKSKAKKLREHERQRLREINMHRAMNEGKRPVGRPSNAETLIEIRDKTMTRLLSWEK